MSINQPQNFNTLKNTSFEMRFSRIPNFTFFCQNVSTPAMILGGPVLGSNPYVDLSEPGDKLVVEQMSASFLVDENLFAYSEIYDWMVGLGYPEGYQNFRDLVETSEETSDCTVFILNSNKNPIIKLIFQDTFPLSLGNLEFQSNAGLIDMVCQVTFAFKMPFKIERL